MLDQLRLDIQTRLDELLAEAEKLRRALTALTSHDGATAPQTRGSSSATRARRRARPGSRSPAPGRTPARPRRSTESPSSTAAVSPEPAESQTTAPPPGASTAPARTAPGATKTAVLNALATGNAMTAGEVANATGLGRASVSTTLSKLANSGEVVKAARGYQIARQPSAGSARAAGAQAEDEPSVA